MTIGHLARVEGHGGITIHISGGKVEKVDMDIYEGSRLYEALLVGRTFNEVAPITARVCGICSAGHALCATKAVEDAFGIEVPERAEIFRKILIHGENIESHSLHVFFLALPDFFGAKSVFELIPVKPALAQAGLSLKKLGNKIQHLIGGRPVHPVNLKPGGLFSYPSEKDLMELLRDVEKEIEKLHPVVEEFQKLEVPEYIRRETTYVALSSDREEYDYTGDYIKTTRGEKLPIRDFRKICNERVVRHSTAKQSLYSGEPFMVGALARIILNGEKLEGAAKEVRDALLSGDIDGNPIYNNFAQLVELVHSLEEVKKLVETSLDMHDGNVESVSFEPFESEGLGALEVPRGTLYHFYRFDKSGKVVDAEIITPTAQNLANIEFDLTACAEKAPLKDRLEVVRRLEMVARAYDPCISCSVHIVEAKETLTESPEKS